MKKELAAIKKEADKARERKREKGQRQRMDRYRGHSIDPAQRASIDRQRQADPYSRFANVEIDEAKSPSLKVRIGENKNRNKNQMNEAYQLSEKILSEGSAKILEMKSIIFEQSSSGEQASLGVLIDPETGEIRADANISPANAWSAAIAIAGTGVAITALLAGAQISMAALAAPPLQAAIVLMFNYLEARIVVDAIFKGIGVLEKYGDKIFSKFPASIKRFFQKIKGSPAKKAEEKIRDSIKKMVKEANLPEDQAKVIVIAVIEK